MAEQQNLDLLLALRPPPKHDEFKQPSQRPVEKAHDHATRTTRRRYRPYRSNQPQPAHTTQSRRIRVSGTHESRRRPRLWKVVQFVRRLGAARTRGHDGALAAVMVDVETEDALEMAPIEDQALGADRAAEALGDRVRLRRPYRRLDDPDLFAAEDSSKGSLYLLSRIGSRCGIRRSTSHGRGSDKPTVRFPRRYQVTRRPSRTKGTGPKRVTARKLERRS
jgi:hypothetical protein